ncbi:hypothetical protein PVAND_003929 [Polypedilum vanderplanki]|uniref:HAT C-terminal dimerisation domain-containing protein n=1 Tax=Polypedilum vanderplanki TaxID=319348 RepID=A0A9J6BW48_POLVA|nr:hypothetical protein PVAND_003929 [Polypedilum vanderplanki]
MYSSIETPLSFEQQQQQQQKHHQQQNINNKHQQYQYHLIDAFNSQHTTASAVSTFLSSSSPSIPSILAQSLSAAKSSECVKSIITPSDGTHEMQQHPSTLFNNNINNDRNKFSYGAYTHNNNNDVKYSKSFNYRTTMVNDKIKLRGPYLQYKLSERDNNGNYQKLDHFSESILDNGVKTNDKVHHYGSTNNILDCKTILPRAKILSNSILDASGVDYNLRTQTIGRYNPSKPTANIIATNDYIHRLKTQRDSGSDENAPFVPNDRKQQQIGYNSHTLPSMRRAHKISQKQQKNHQQQPLYAPSYITLDSALNFEFFNHLTPTQGWALLCQSIQALQDLFLSEPPSINHIMPVITPNNFMLTSRGRVVYGLLSIDKYDECVNEYISDEFHQFISGRKMNYNESDIEKMWIFSLGRSLMKTLPRTTTVASIKSMQSVQNQCAIVLQATIYKMCSFNVNERASLMFLLNVKVISYAGKLATRLFDNVDDDKEEVIAEMEAVSSEQMTLECELDLILQKDTVNVSKIDNKFKWLKQEFTLFKNTGERTENLKKLHKAILCIKPTSTDVERVFSISNNFCTKIRSRLSE